MLLQALASGSNGNAFYIRSGSHAVIIDVGISRKRIINKIEQLGHDPQDVEYILITHAHSDHIAGLPVLSSYIDFKIVTTPETIDELRKLVDLDYRYSTIADNAIPIKVGQTLILDNLQVTCYRAIHDINGAAGFSLYFSNENIVVSYTTDNKEIIPEFRQAMRGSDFIIIESNHDKELLLKSRRPVWLKKRISDTHLSNRDMISTLESVLSKKTKVVFLAHLSGECNTPEHVCDMLNSFKSYCERKKPDLVKWRWIVCTREESGTICKFDDEIYLTGSLFDETFRTNGKEYSFQKVDQRIDAKEYFRRKTGSSKIVNKIKKDDKPRSFQEFFD